MIRDVSVDSETKRPCQIEANKSSLLTTRDLLRIRYSNRSNTCGSTGVNSVRHRNSRRATFVSITDDEALEGFQLLSRLEGIIPALESSHAVSWIAKNKGRWAPEDNIVLCVSGRGDKDVAQVSGRLKLGA